MKRTIMKIGMWTMFVGSFCLIVLGILFMALDHNYIIGACHFLWAFVAVSQACSLQTSLQVDEENKVLQGELIKAGEDDARNARIIARKEQDIADMKAHFDSYRQRKESEENADWKKRQEHEELLNVATNVMHAYLIANSIQPEWRLYGENGVPMPFPDCCVKLAKDIIEKSK